MKVIFALLIAAALGYFLGSLNFSIIVVKLLKGRDIRTVGSRNAGLTNTYRCFGPQCAALTLVGDLLKGVVAVLLSQLFASMLKVGFAPDNEVKYIGFIAGFFAILGHVFPIYYGFKGGKGVLVGVASFLPIEPRVFLTLLIIFIVVFVISRYVSVSSIMGAAAAPFAIFFMSLIVDGAGFGRSLLYMLLCIPMAGMVVYMHRSNIERYMEGTESKFTFKFNKNQ
ncbi:MAG: glycerol-3-phosphate 1-O-acyltransferase PlsY [Ruminococcus sp.]|jgi:glycerol-3-phosphate acyltransferase PlsY|nr:glycerol-3-phosphate 1-O-acyltransferase PlsY [Ruminococcus sp.]MBR3901140.1 glycerol-3-phosphate 1-O-acyltransferase PlsY [Ruminococcus sp.]